MPRRVRGCLLGRAVGLGHGRQIGLRLDVQIEGAKVRERDRVGGVGQEVRELEIGAHRADAARLQRESGSQHERVVPGRPTTWIDERPAGARAPASRAH